MSIERVYVTEPDLLTLAYILEAESRWPSADRQVVLALRSKLAGAAVVPEQRVPPDVVTLLSRVHVKDLKTGSDTNCLLVVPAYASTAGNRVSVLSPLGAALLGGRQGDEVDYWVQGGRRRSRVERVLFQPEAQRRPSPHDPDDQQRSTGERREPGRSLALTRVA